MFKSIKSKMKNRFLKHVSRKVEKLVDVPELSIDIRDLHAHVDKNGTIHFSIEMSGSANLYEMIETAQRLEAP